MKEMMPDITGSVSVLLLKSWGVTTGWEDLKTQWQNYGTTPITIDDSTYLNSDFTYQDLVNSGANVIVLSDSAGGEQQYSSAEMAAVARYALAGHTVLGTYAVFDWTVDNRGLMPIFGLRASLPYYYTGISNSFVHGASASCLFHNLPSNWQSFGYAYSQVPSSHLRWNPTALNAAQVVAESDNFKGIITVYNEGNYTAIYISNFPEYNGETNDLQLLYNAVTCY